MKGTRIPREDLLIYAGLFLATLAAYAGVLSCGFVNLDDGVYIRHNPFLHSGFTLHSLKWVLLSFQPDNWFPVTRLSHLIDYTLFGEDAAFHHAVSLLIHAGASLLLYGFLRSAQMGGRWGAAFVAFLFALHPLHVESVAWASERKDVLCAFFWFAAMWAWVEWVKRPTEKGYYLSLGLFALGIMSKPMIVTFPVLLLLLDVWPLRRTPIRLAEKLPFFGLSLCAAFLTWHAQAAMGGIQALGTYGLGLRVENALVTPWIYIGKTLWPLSLRAIYSWPDSFPLWQPLAGGLGLAAISGLVLWHLRRRPSLAVGWFWFLITLAPVIGLVQVGNQARADRYMYVPMVGLGVMLASLGSELPATAPGLRRPLAALVCAGLAGCAALTWVQVRYWENGETLFTHAVQEDPADYSAWYFLGSALSQEPDREADMVNAYESAVRAKSDFFEAREHLAAAHCAIGKNDLGLMEFAGLAVLRPHDLWMNADYGTALANLNRVPEAIPYFREALRTNPQYRPALLGLGNALVKSPETLAEGMAKLEEAQQQEPSPELEAQLEQLKRNGGGIGR